MKRVGLRRENSAPSLTPLVSDEISLPFSFAEEVAAVYARTNKDTRADKRSGNILGHRLLQDGVKMVSAS
jgi:hypothetical protein